ncbi:hypothetical protein M8C21_001306 [Ambrosia artemisiifolia]|uniref:DNA polymerase epsilon catalytic subunit n=1 Tax=Ambrosia artemisiifolia TaxID=4212 RepID=A0AAD5GF90_AMBAR|nr:hypothetical protein M8C21_001306 [Ambrosia artemisiifolia]
MDSHETDGNGVAGEALPPPPPVPEDVVPEQAREPAKKKIMEFLTMEGTTKRIQFYFDERKVAVELKVRSINLLFSVLVNQHAFRALRALIQRCLADAVSSGNIFADELLQHVYRWLCSARSKLHDPALVRMLHKVMQKFLRLLLAEFRKLGAAIIFANYSKVILDTGKHDLLAAQAYCDGLLEALQKRDLFKWIELEPTQLWIHCYSWIRPQGAGSAMTQTHSATIGISQHVGAGSLLPCYNDWAICILQCRTQAPLLLDM